MNRVKNNKGITIMMLVITVIIMLILVMFAVYYSRNAAVEARIAAAYTSLKEVKEACERAIIEIELDPSTYDEYYFFGRNVQTDGSNLAEIQEKCGGVTLSERSYKISDSTDDENKRRLDNLEISKIKDTFIVDLENKKYYILDGVKKADGNKVYEYREIQLSYDMLTATK